MKKKLYLVIDVQNDFISGSLGSAKAQEVTPKIAEFLSKVYGKEETVGIWATRDTHCSENTLTDFAGFDPEKHISCVYENTLEGQKLPIRHCIYNTDGWEIDNRVIPYINKGRIFDKPTFMSLVLGKGVIDELFETSFDEIVIMGFCTGICVASNAIYLRGLMPDMKITVLEDLCACVNEETHKAALTTMSCCQIDIMKSDEYLEK